MRFTAVLSVCAGLTVASARMHYGDALTAQEWHDVYGLGENDPKPRYRKHFLPSVHFPLPRPLASAREKKAEAQFQRPHG